MVRPDGCVGGAGDMYVHIIAMRSMLYFRASQKKDVSFFWRRLRFFLFPIKKLESDFECLSPQHFRRFNKETEQ